MSKNILMEKLDYLVQKTIKELERAPWEDKNFYSNWLAQTHYYTNHTTRLLALAGASLPLEEQALHNRFLKHAAEEKGHENLTLLDLKNLGMSIDQLAEMPATRSFYQVQYYWIEHGHPLAFFGFILYLESIAAYAGQQLGDRIESHYKARCSHFLRVHGEEDVDHVKEALTRAQNMSPENQQKILLNLEQSADLYEKILQSCRESRSVLKTAA